MSDWAMQVYQKSCEDMSEIPDGSVQTCVTSPPYFGLRDYGTGTWEGGDAACDHSRQSAASRLSSGIEDAKDTQGGAIAFRGVCARCGATRTDERIGLEPSLEEYVARLVGVFREVRRVLRGDGTLWLNLGDSYVSNGRYDEAYESRVNRGGINASSESKYAKNHDPRPGAKASGLKPKDLMGVPWAVAFALRADGWYLRDAIVWAKPSCMPSSVTDRCTSSYEMIFQLAKSARYFCDMDAIREPLIPHGPSTPRRGTAPATAYGVSKLTGNMRHGEKIESPESGANKRNVWTIASRPYSDAHFATFPPELPSLCIRAGTSEAGCCAKCGASRVRVVEKGEVIVTGGLHRPGPPEVHNISQYSGNMATGEVRGRERITTGFAPSCSCDAPTVGSVVLDPFMGSGTVAEVAESLGRRWVGYELSPEYHKLIQGRTRQKGLFTEGAA